MSILAISEADLDWGPSNEMLEVNCEIAVIVDGAGEDSIDMASEAIVTRNDEGIVQVVRPQWIYRNNIHREYLVIVQIDSEPSTFLLQRKAESFYLESLQRLYLCIVKSNISLLIASIIINDNTPPLLDPSVCPPIGDVSGLRSVTCQSARFADTTMYLFRYDVCDGVSFPIQSPRRYIFPDMFPVTVCFSRYN